MLVGYQSTTATLKCVKHIYKTQENCGATTQRMEKNEGNSSFKNWAISQSFIISILHQVLAYSYTLLDAKKKDLLRLKRLNLYLQKTKPQNYMNLDELPSQFHPTYFYLQSKSLVQIWTWTLHLLQKQGTNKYFRLLK